MHFLEVLQTELQSAFGQQLKASKFAFGELTVEVAPSDWLAVAERLRDDFDFEQLIDVCGVDYSAYRKETWEIASAPNTGFSRGVFDFDEEDLPVEALNAPRRFASVYHLLSIKKNLRLRVKVYAEASELPVVPSVISVWNDANWFEREAFDMYGIIYTGHPDLRRLLTDYGFIGYPLRKDFPLVGHVEMRYDPVKGRVVYEPVEMENRVNTPRIVRDGRGVA
jgi:NADH-quinone oxidoreductase subunit C